ncbi:unnamed protein product [Nezara viridula]|uniref:Uncharacterized protein n=1 Tax=Nezara viridula TaxID=85310 RepID=A0A9P0MHQ0_NEZVI|nr:unnamed protein product [Nezara viridula]
MKVIGTANEGLQQGQDPRHEIILLLFLKDYAESSRTVGIIPGCSKVNDYARQTDDVIVYVRSVPEGLQPRYISLHVWLLADNIGTPGLQAHPIFVRPCAQGFPGSSICPLIKYGKCYSELAPQNGYVGD